MRLMAIVIAAALAAAPAVAAAERSADVAPPPAEGAEAPAAGGTVDEASAEAPLDEAGTSADRTFVDIGNGEGRPDHGSPVDPPDPCDSGG